MKTDRRTFIGSALGALALGGCGTVSRLADAPEHGFKWIDLIHLGMNMWGDRPLKDVERNGIMTKNLTDEEFNSIMRNPDVLAKDRLHFDEPFWKESS